MERINLLVYSQFLDQQLRVIFIVEFLKCSVALISLFTILLVLPQPGVFQYGFERLS